VAVKSQTKIKPMKKLALLAALALMGTVAWAQQVSIVNLNNFDPDRPIFFQNAGTAATMAQNVSIQVLAGPAGTALGPANIIKNTDGLDTFTLAADSYFDGGIGIIPGATGTGPFDFEFRAWTGGGTYDGALNRDSLTWSQQTTAWDSTPPNPPPANIAALALPSSPLIELVPEPSTIALGLLGAAALLIRRRK
jgi:hypothetical protein